MSAERAAHPNPEGGRIRLVCHIHFADGVAKGRCPLIATADNLFDPRNGPRLQEPKRPRPGEWAFDRDLELEPADRLVGILAERRRRAPVDFVDHRVEPANAPKARRLRNVRHRQACGLDQAPREVGAPSPRHLNGRCSQMLVEEPPKLARPNAKTLAQPVDARVVEQAILDQPKRARHGGRRPVRRRRTGRCVGPALAACAKAGGFRIRRGAEEPEVLGGRLLGRAARPTVQTGRRSSCYESTVKPGIIAKKRP